MSKHDFSVFPSAIASALQRALGSYLTPRGAAVRHANGFEELLVSYPRLDVQFPEHYPLYVEGFRKEGFVPAVAKVEEKAQEPAKAAPEVPAKPKAGKKGKQTPATDEKPSEAPVAAPEDEAKEEDKPTDAPADEVKPAE